MNQANYRNKRFDNKRNNAHKYNMGSMFKKFIRLFNFSLRRNKVKEPVQRVSPISSILRKSKNRNCAIKQYVQMKRDHSHLWSGSIELVVS